MSKLTERASYLKGLAEGLKLNTEKDANRLLLEVVGLVNDIAEEIDALQTAQDEMQDYLESVDDDLADLEEVFFAEEDSEPDEYPDEEEDDEEEDGGDDEDDTVITYACPHCGHLLELKASEIDFDEDCLCPECGKEVFPEVWESPAEEEKPAEDEAPAAEDSVEEEEDPVEHPDEE